ncbi:STAS domain-containing protein [Alkalibacillus salilacus]|uniref:Anti-sigma B factor antagonist/stage II sporulation protein AA (Anti-sigma F factor antagonist) n=1 Tax=Alkalibacillus salilacus TaxID=284582 RepID=A0ABT9VIV7_9BACI|nr:STAS domain-containing protein [Alkalibacillus salilacus]MDQ0160903.1 anti-sigma B factor antagonist/stage II sporulation protein AA (anti-sigma F factor antagonist) [Alkalibacillus salilacus]
MKYDLTSEDEEIELTLSGGLDLESTDLFEKEIYPVLAERLEHYKKLNINMHEVAFVDSTGVGVIIQFVNWARIHEVDVTIINMQEQVYEIFHFMQIDNILGIDILKADTLT